jgi:D-Tyr-tRNAtyr deacylase
VALYEFFLASLCALGIEAETGEIRAVMDGELVTDGPVALLLDSYK